MGVCVNTCIMQFIKQVFPKFNIPLSPLIDEIFSLATSNFFKAVLSIILVYRVDGSQTVNFPKTKTLKFRKKIFLKLTESKQLYFFKPSIYELIEYITVLIILANDAINYTML